MIKGQIQQVFVYIITIVIIGLVMIVGYKSVGSLMAKGCDVEITTFKSTLATYIDKHSDYKAFNVEEIKAPCDFTELCFADVNAIGNPPLIMPSTYYAPDYALMISSIEDGIEENVFLKKKKVTEPSGFFPEINVDTFIRPPSFIQDVNFICFERQGNKFHVAFRGLGKKVNITSAP